MASGESRGRTPAGWDESGIGALYALEDVRAYFVVRAAGARARNALSLSCVPSPKCQASAKRHARQNATRADFRTEGVFHQARPIRPRTNH